VLLEGSNCIILDCLDTFTETESLAGAEQYECQNCMKLQKATKKMTILKVPNVNISIFILGLDASYEAV
jgi:ubiquitin C-terminal hydrolase